MTISASTQRYLDYVNGSYSFVLVDAAGRLADRSENGSCAQFAFKRRSAALTHARRRPGVFVYDVAKQEFLNAV